MIPVSASEEQFWRFQFVFQFMEHVSTVLVCRSSSVSSWFQGIGALQSFRSFCSGGGEGSVMHPQEIHMGHWASSFALHEPPGQAIKKITTEVADKSLYG